LEEKEMNDTAKNLISMLNFENKEFEKEAVKLFTEMFETIEVNELEWDKTHPNPRGLDGGFNTRRITDEYFARFRDLKLKYGIEDKHR
jgi:hypothetical protein